jgi:amidophosphoribosyltransferase
MHNSFESPYPPELAEVMATEQGVDDELRHECGVMAVCAEDLDMARQMQVGLERMKHRGHDSAGIAMAHEGEIVSDSRDGSPENLFKKRIMTKYRTTPMIIGGTRYATTGAVAGEANRHPFPGSGPHGEIAVVYNGNIINTAELHDEVSSMGFVAKGSTDSEMVAFRLANGPGDSLEDSVTDFVDKYPAGYSGVVLTPDRIIAFRDGYGVRPLQLGKVGSQGWAVASETRVFRSLQYHPNRSIAPGEVVRLQPGERPITISHNPNSRHAACIFENIYFSGPESELDGEYVGAIRDEMGRQLAREDIIRGTVPEVDVIFGLPESGRSMGEGYAEELFREGYQAFHKNAIIRNRGRSFNDPDPKRIIEEKFNPLPHVLKGKRVLVVDDSIVRGNTGPYIVEMLRDAGATEVHFRVASPPFVDTCHKGVNIPVREVLIAHRHDSIEGIRDELKANSLQYLSLEGTLLAVQKHFDEVCAGCLSKVYPMHIPDKEEDHLVSDDMKDIPDELGMIFSPQPTVR